MPVQQNHQNKKLKETYGKVPILREYEGGSSQRRVGLYELRDCIATRIRPSGQRIDLKCIFSQFRYDNVVLSEVSGVGKKEG
jgi:hypothetical protein